MRPADADAKSLCEERARARLCSGCGTRLEKRHLQPPGASSTGLLVGVVGVDDFQRETVEVDGRLLEET